MECHKNVLSTTWPEHIIRPHADPAPKDWSDYCAGGTLVAWGVKVLKWLDEPRPTGQELDSDRIEEKLGWLREYREPLRRWEQAMQVIETVETFVRREGHHAESAVQLREQLPRWTRIRWRIVYARSCWNS